MGLLLNAISRGDLNAVRICLHVAPCSLGKDAVNQALISFKDNKFQEKYRVIFHTILSHTKKGLYKDLLGNFLLDAIKKNASLKAIKTILQQDPSLDLYSPKTGYYAIHEAVFQKREDIVRALLKHNPELLKQRSGKEQKGIRARQPASVKKNKGKREMRLASLKKDKGIRARQLAAELKIFNLPQKPLAGGPSSAPGTGLFSVETDLKKWPNIKNKNILENYNTLTVGDMHGNAPKLIHILTLFSIWNLSKTVYERLKQLYCSNLSQSDSKSFAALINNLKPNTGNPIKKIRFLGDLFADRGVNDILTLLVLKWLDDNKIEYDIMLSNHDFELLFAYKSKNIKNYSPDIETDQSISFHGLQYAIIKYNLDIVDVEILIEKHFLAHLKIFEVDILPANSGKKRIIISTHAPISFNIIQAILSKYAGVKQGLSSGNIKYATNEANGNFRTFDYMEYKRKSYGTDCGFYKENPIGHPLATITWAHKVYESKFAPHNISQTCDLYFVHGHVGTTLPLERKVKNATYYNLDTDLGKSLKAFAEKFRFLLSYT